MEQTLNDMKKDVLITVKGTQRVSGETDVTEMMTTGRFYRKNKLYYISYEETEATGYSGCPHHPEGRPQRQSDHHSIWLGTLPAGGGGRGAPPVPVRHRLLAR